MKNRYNTLVKSKRGMLVGVIGIFVIIVALCSLFIYYFVTFPTNKNMCEKNYYMYNLEDCIKHLDDIKVCESIGAVWIKTEINLFSSNVQICNKNGETIRI